MADRDLVGDLSTLKFDRHAVHKLTTMVAGRLYRAIHVITADHRSFTPFIAYVKAYPPKCGKVTVSFSHYENTDQWAGLP